MFIILDVLCTLYIMFLSQRNHLEEKFFAAECSVSQGSRQVDIIQNPIRCLTLIWTSSTEVLS